MTGNQVLGKLQSHTLVHITDSKLLAAPYSSSGPCWKMKGPQGFTAADLEGHLCPSLCDSPRLSLCSKDTYMKSVKTPFFSPQQQSWGLAFCLGSEFKE